MEAGLASVVIITCLGAEAFFSGAEIALYSANKLKVRHAAEHGSRGAQLILRMLDKPEQLLGSTLVLHNLVVVTGTSVATALFVDWLGHRGEWVALAAMTALVLTVGEVFPKTVFQRHADRLAGIVIYPLRAVFYACYPMAYLITKVISHSMRVFGVRAERKNPFVTKEELELLVRLSGHGSTLNADERHMIRRIFGFSDTRVREAMIPLVEVVALEDTATVDELVRIIREHGFSRIPIFQGNIHNIVGWVNAFDVLSLASSERSFRHLIRPAYYVPETRRIGDLLRDVQQKGIPLAVVVDEYGGTVGIVTLEDMLEEIVGEIEDEYDVVQRLYEVLSDGSYRIDARMEIDAINEALGLNIPTGDYATLAGFILAQLERLPQRGELLMHDGLMLEVEAATNRTVERVRVFPRPSPAGAPEDA
ncbi:MAG: HlyC/CorC family transporter [Nitrospinae bacterium]|nr:HlyC/CorC family transporter [Nitrospinota bacterium]